MNARPILLAAAATVLLAGPAPAETADRRKSPAHVAEDFASALVSGDVDALVLMSDTFVSEDIQELSAGSPPFFNDLRDFEYLARCAQEGLIAPDEEAFPSGAMAGRLAVCQLPAGAGGQAVSVFVDLMSEGDLWFVSGLSSSTPDERAAQAARRDKAAADAMEADPAPVVSAYMEALAESDYVAAARLATGRHSDALLYIARDGRRAMEWQELDSRGLFDCAEAHEPGRIDIRREPDSAFTAEAQICDEGGDPFARPVSLSLRYQGRWMVEGVNW